MLTVLYLSVGFILLLIMSAFAITLFERGKSKWFHIVFYLVTSLGWVYWAILMHVFRVF